jgi:hypothetical protein
MRFSPLFLGWGVLVLGMTAMAEYNGWSLARINQVENVPKTVRDNPGAYRSTYGYYNRYIGGK